MLNPFQYVQNEPYKMYIDGEFVTADSGETFDIINPATNEVFAEAYKGSSTDMKKAITAARNAFDKGPWGEMTQLQRSKLLMKARNILAMRTEEFACLEALDCGKLYRSTLYYEVPQSIDGFEFSAGKARCLHGKVNAVDGDGKYLNYVVWQPQGVVGEILPWNGPLMMGCQKVASILAAGNTVVIKPSTWASLSTLELATVFHEAGFPPGVVNVVTGSGSIVGNVLVDSEEVDMISLTGSTSTGKHIIETSADTIKNIALELGGKSPNIVFDDVELERTIKWAVFGFTLNSGQVCVAGSRLILHENIYEAFLDGLKQYCEQLKPGNGFDDDKGVNFGPLISKAHFNRVWNYIELGKKEGATLITGGQKYTSPDLARGNFIPPTVFADVTPNMRLFKEEIFGPVLCVSKFKTEKEAIELANNTRYGLGGAVFTNDISRAHRVAEKLKSGQVYINTYYSKGIMESPGTGWKESGVGHAGIYKYMHPKTVFVELNEKSVPPV